VTTVRLLGGRYQLLHEIARGGMAVVWRAQDTLLDRHVAIKVLHPQFADDPEFIERFHREARAAARLSHPNIVPLFDVGDVGDAGVVAEHGTPYIVMELVEGGNLKDRIRRAAPLSESEIRSMGATLAMTLDYAHHKGLVHRDVKPQNVLLGEDGRPRLTDFGIAQALASSGLTRTGAVMGSVHYIAPELVRGGKAVPQSDVYSLGVVLFEMATGRLPFQAETDIGVALAQVEQPPPSPRALNARLSPDLERVILRSLAKIPDQRYVTAADLAAALRTASNGQARADRSVTQTQRMPVQTTTRVAPPARRGPALAPQATPAPRRATRSRRGPGASTGVLVLLLALAAILVAVGVGFFGLATFSRERVESRSADATPPPATPAPTAAPRPVVELTSTPRAATATPQPSATPDPPSPTPIPATATSLPVPVPIVLSPSALPRPPATPPAIAVPGLRGRSLEDAQATLRAAGLTVVVKGVAANVDRDVVADQTPDAGATLPVGGTVTVLVGTGVTQIPDVSNLPQDQATRTLQANSFRVTQRSRRDPRVPANFAIGTNPPAGTPANRGGEVELDISAGR
jgi:serine/threonine-protein kinase